MEETTKARRHEGSVGWRGDADGRTEEVTRAVIGAAIEVHKVLGPGFLESVYEEALAIELQLRGIRFVRQASLAVYYKGSKVGEGRVDLLVEELVIVELKAVDDLHEVHRAQAMSYLKASNLRVALLLNFKAPLMKDGIRRIIL